MTCCSCWIDTSGNINKERYFGGDGSTRVVATGGCSSTLPSTPGYDIRYGWTSGVLSLKRYYDGTTPMFMAIDRTIDGSGAVTSERDSAGVETTYSYDDLGRLTTISPTGETASSITYVNASGTTTRAAATLTRGDTSATTTFDGLGRTITETHSMPGSVTALRATTYDLAGRNSTVSEFDDDTVTSSHTTSYTYDIFDRPLTVTAPDGKVVTNSYTGVQSTLRSSLVQGVGATITASATERYDPLGRLAAVTEGSGAGGANVTTTYAYDVGDRLKSATTSNGTTPTHTFTYDNRGLLQSESHPEKIGSMHSLTTSNGSTTYYIYDAADERLATVVRTASTNQSTTRWTLRGLDNELLRTHTDTNGSFAWTEDNIFRGSQRLANESSAGTKHYALDHLGSPRVVTNGSGTLIGYEDFAPFGEGGATGSGSLQFTGHERDWSPAGGSDPLDYMHARFYGSTAGRFLSLDGHFGDQLSPQSWNRYTYVLNNPVNLFDPTGLEERQPGQQMDKGDTCNGAVIDGWCTGESITVVGTDPQISPWGLGWEWLSGAGPRDRKFTDGDKMTEMLKQHAHVQKVAHEVCDGSRSPRDSAGYGLGGFSGVPKYMRDYSTLATGGLTDNLAVTYLGSFSLTNALDNGIVNMHVENSSSAASAFRPPVIGYTPAWQKAIAGPLNQFFSAGPMSKTTQEFDFSVPCQ